MSRKIATLADLQSNRSGGGQHSDSDSDEGQNFYVGGSETSGQQVRGPPRHTPGANSNNPDPMAIIRDVFQGAQRHGAQQVQPITPEAAGRPVFSGVGRKLGEEETPAEVVSTPSEPDSPTEVQVAIHMWQNGFSLNDGELRSYTDPANIAFLDAIKRGQVPDELQRAHRGQSLVVDLDARQSEDFVAPRRPRATFTGSGHMLGNPVPNVLAAANSAENAVATGDIPAMKIDANLPTTQIRIQMPNGSKVVATVNLGQTVGDLRAYVIRVDENLGGVEFQLLTTFPRRELTDLTATVAGEKLQNAVVMVKLV